MKLTKARNELRYSRKAIADKLDIAQSTYASWEADKTYPKPKYITKLAEMLMINVAELIDDQWNLALSEPSAIHGEEDIFLLESNARKIFEDMIRSQQLYSNHLESENEKLRRMVLELKKKLGTSRNETD